MVKIAIIGSGVGGTALAGYLAKQGHQVQVYEKNGYSGGRCSLIQNGPYRFDQGPSLLLMPYVFYRIFEDFEESMDQHINLLKCDPNYRIYTSDTSFELNTDLCKLKETLEGLEAGSFGPFLSHMKESHIHLERSKTHVLDKLFINWYDMFTLENLSLVWKLHVYDTLFRRVSTFFKSDALRHAFTFQSMYMGMSPYDAPATYSLLQYTELADGIWYPEGGFHKVIEKLEMLARDKYGATFHYNRKVTEIVIENQKATGVKFSDGSFESADIVVSNLDLVSTYKYLLPIGDHYVSQLERQKLTSSTFSFYWSMKTKVKGLEAHNIFLAGDYKSSFDEIFNDFDLPNEPSFYVHVPSRIDPTASPEGKDAIMVLCPVGHLGGPDKSKDWTDIQARARACVISTLNAQLSISNFEEMIDSEIVNTPHTWQEKFGLYQGAALGLSHTITQVCWFRPSPQHAKFKNVYFVGASTQPGTGVPIVLCGARALAKVIAKETKRKQGDKAKGMWGQVILLALFVLFLYPIAQHQYLLLEMQQMRETYK